MNQQQKEFVLAIDQNCKTHQDWFVLVDYGLNTLLKDQDVLVELLQRESEREMARRRDEGEASLTQAQLISKFLEELGLKFAPVK